MALYCVTVTSFTVSNFSCITRDKQKERSRQEKLKVYQETGSWPGFKKAPDSGNKGTAAW